MPSKQSPTLPAFMRRMTPEKFKAMSKEDQREYRKKSNAWLKQHDEEIDRKNAKAHESLAFGIAQLVQLDPRIESEIVLNYLKRTCRSMVPDDFMVDHPEFARALADYEVKQLHQARASKKAARSRKSN